MSNIIYVGKLSSETTEEQLNTLFSTVGEVIAINITRKIGFKQNNDSAYITMTSEKTATEAIAKFNNTLVDGSRIKVTGIHAVDQKGHTFFARYHRRNRN